jgi:cardiolipin synthase A/B
VKETTLIGMKDLGKTTKKSFEEQLTMNVGLTILLIILLICVWLSLDYALGRKKHLANLKQRNYPIRLSHVDVFTHGKDLFSSYFKDLREASHHIHVLFYIVKDDRISNEFFSILQEKAMAGVEVRILLDWVGSFPVKRKTVQALESAGIQFAFCHKPTAPFFFYTLQVRNHRKISIIDGNIAYMGGYNVGKEYIDEDPKLTPWRDYHLRLTGEVAQDLQSEFLSDWRKCAKTNLLNNSIYFPKLQPGSIRNQVFPSEGFHLERMFSNLIKKAEKSITIGTPYFIPSKRVMDDLIIALKRGVKVAIIVPSMTDHLLVQEASFRYLRRILNEGGTVYQYLKGFYHAKTLMIDDTICDIGTANFDKRSFFLNHEINCFTYDSAFIQSVKEIISKDIQDSKILTLRELNNQSFSKKLLEVIARLFSNFL